MKKELRYYSRKELVDIIYQLKKNEERLKAENESLKEQLEARRVIVDKAISVARSAFELSDVVKRAESTAELYLSVLENTIIDEGENE